MDAYQQIKGITHAADEFSQWYASLEKGACATVLTELLDCLRKVVDDKSAETRKIIEALKMELEKHRLASWSDLVKRTGEVGFAP